MSEENRTILIGAIASLVLGVAVALVLTVDSSDLQPGVTIEVHFAHPGALPSGADVQIGGRVVGKVSSIHLIDAHGLDADHPLAKTGGAVARVRIFSRYRKWVRKNSEFFVSAKGILASNYLEVAPPPRGEELLPPVEKGDRIRGSDPARLEEIVVMGFSNVAKTRALLEQIAPDAKKLGDSLTELSRTLDSIDPAIYDKLSDATAKLGQELDVLAENAGAVDISDVIGVTARARAFVGEVGGELDRIKVSLDRLTAELDRVSAHVPGEMREKLTRSIVEARQAVDKLRNIISQTQDMIANIERGQGTIGALLNDPEFIDNAKKLGQLLKRQPWLIISRPEQQQAPQ